VREDRSSERTCIVTRRRDAPEEMIRFVRAPDGMVAPDIRSRLPGRGVWVTARAEFVAEAARKQAFSRSFKASSEASPTLARDVEALLESDCLQMLALANKAGLVIAGFGKVATALEKDAVAAVIEAKDGGEDGRRKLAQCARRRENLSGVRPKVVAMFASGQLDLALGRTNVIHAALAHGGPTEAFLARCARLAHYRGENVRDFASAQEAGGDCARDAGAIEFKNSEHVGRADPGSETE
jgi:predicted RNA-binding protein YlxR (DUF448 family)